MSLEPVHLDFIDSPYDPSLTPAPRSGARPNPFPLVGLTAAQFDAVAAWDFQLDDERSDEPADRKGAADDRLPVDERR